MVKIYTTPPTPEFTATVCEAKKPDRFGKHTLREGKNIRLIPCIHKGEKRLRLVFHYDRELIDFIRTIPDCRWSTTMHCWHVPDNEKSRVYLRVIKADVVPGNYTEDTSLQRWQGTLRHVALEIDEYNQQIFINFPYDEYLKNGVKKLSGSWWHTGIKKWSVDYSTENLEKLKELFNPATCNLEITVIKQEGTRRSYARKPVLHGSVPKYFINELKMQDKSIHTIRQYEAAIAGFLDHFKNRDAGSITTSEIRDYILYYREKLNYSTAFQNQMISALKLYYRIIHKREISGEELPRSRKGRSLPRIISREEVEALIRSNSNPKHRLMLMLMYGCGLRLGEVINLKIEDIDFNRRQICIYNGKGRKDRSINLTQKLGEQIKKYLTDYAPSGYLFNGQRGMQYSRESVGQIVKNSAHKAGIKKKVTPHVLRHCYATHMLEKGVDLRYIQYLLGHKSSKTTEIYTHISNYRLNDLGSPIDDIEI